VAPHRIVRLADRPEAVDVVARWHVEEWGSVQGAEGFERGRRRLASWATAGGIPCAYVAVVAGEVCGSAALVDHDMPGPPEGTETLGPWLSGVFVTSGRRGTGLGPALVGAVEEAAAALGHSRLYLYTAPATAQRFYAPMGWRGILTPHYDGEAVVVMEKILATPGTDARSTDG